MLPVNSDFDFLDSFDRAYVIIDRNLQIIKKGGDIDYYINSSSSISELKKEICNLISKTIVSPDNHHFPMEFSVSDETNPYKFNFCPIDSDRLFLLTFPPQNNALSAIQRSDLYDLSRQELINIVETVADIICITDLKGVFIYISDECEAIFGYKPKEMIGRPFSDFVFQDDIVKTKEAINNISQNVYHINFENRYQHKNGNIVHLSWSTKLDANTNVLYSTARDISIIKEVERRAFHNEELMIEAQKLAKMGSWNFDFRTDKLTWSDPLYDVFGADKNTFQETHGSFLTLIVDEDREYAQNTSRRSQETGEPFNIRYRITTPNGEKRIIEEFGYAEKDGQGNIVRLFGTAQNVTDKVVAQTQLEENEKRFKALVENGLDAIVILSAEGKATYASPSITKVLGYSPEEAVQISLVDVVHPDDLNDVASAMQEALNNPGKPIKGHTSRTKHKDGTWRWLEATITNLLHEPAINGIVDNFRDVTEKVILIKVESLERDILEKSLKEAADLKAILTDFIVGLENVFDNMHTSIMMVENNRIYGYLGPSLPSEFLTAFNEFEIGPQHGSCGTAAYMKKAVIVSDIQSDPLWSDYKEHALKYGFKASWSHPIFNSSNEVIATFANYYKSIKSPSKTELDLFSRIASIMGVIIESNNKSKLIRESNERYNYITEATSDAIYDWDVASDVFHWGEGFYRITGYTKDNSIFKLEDWVRLTHPGDALKHEARWHNFITDKNQSKWTNEFRFLHSNGSYLYVEEIGHLIRDRKGEPIRMIGVLRDQTVFKIGEIKNDIRREVGQIFNGEIYLRNALDKSLAYIAQYFNYHSAEIWIAQHNQKTINLISKFASDQQIEKYFELNRINVFGIDEGMPGTIWKNGKIELWKDVANHTKFLRKEAALAGGLNAFLGLPLYDNEKFLGVLMFGCIESSQISNINTYFIEDIGSFLSSEIKRKQQEEELHLFFESAPEILAIATPDGKFGKVNPAFCKIMGYTSEELTSRPFKDFIHPDDLTGTIQEYDETITGERNSNNFVNRYITKNGEIRWISWSSSDVYGDDGYVFAYGRDITEMRELQSLFDSAAKMAKMGSWEVDMKDPNNTTVYWSPMTCEILGKDYNHTPTLAEGIAMYVSESRIKVQEAIDKVSREGGMFDLELLIEKHEAGQIWVRVMGQAQMLNGRCIKIIGSIQDINERKLSEKALLKAYDENITILESIGDGFFTVDNNFMVTYWNHMAEKLLQTPKFMILGKNLWDVFEDAVSLPSYGYYQQALRRHEAVHFEDYYEAIGKWFEVSAYPSANGLSVYFKDITARKQYEEQIMQSNERFEKIAQATNDAVWDFDVQNNKLSWGKGFETNFGYNIHEISPSMDFVLDLIHPDDREAIASKIASYFMPDGETNWHEEYRFKKANGTYAYIIDRAIFIRNYKKQVQRVVGAMTDISYRREYEESLEQLNSELKRHAKELEASNAELEQFAYVASHDLQEPLRMVSSFMSQLEKKYGPQLDEKANQYIYYAVDGAKRMRQIILDLLEYSRVGRFTYDKETLDLNEIIDDYCILRQKLIKEKSAELKKDELPQLLNYRAPVMQIFHNLLDNSLKYSKENIPAEIHISVVQNRNMWQFCVSDNGIGISSEYFERIFIIFQRLHDKSSYGGTGMGLAIVKKIIKTLGGNIWVESQEGVGSKFYFTIPK